MIEPSNPPESLRDAMRTTGGKIRIGEALAAGISNGVLVTFRWCVDAGVATVEPGSVRAAGVEPIRDGDRRPRGGGTDRGGRGSGPSGRGGAPVEVRRVDGIAPDGRVRFAGGGDLVKLDGVSDEVLAVRPGATFSRKGNRYVFEGYAPDVAPGLEPGRPDVDRNPYGFAAWHGKSPWAAEDCEGALHHAEREERRNGVLRLTYEAVTPVFVPSSDEEQQSFFDCWDGKRDRYAIPGSSVKGVVRSLLEILTNSRAGVSDDGNLRELRLYRRRANDLFRIVQLPSPASPGVVERCGFEFLDADNRIQELRNRRSNDPLPSQHEIDSGTVPTVEWRANLYWVERSRYSHGRKERLAYKPSGHRAGFSLAVHDAYLGMDGHSQFRAHQANSEGAKGYKPQGAPPYETVRDKLFALNEGDLVFGIEHDGELVCFGKNVNFLWPSRHAPKDLVGAFSARAPADARFADSDVAELTFGFIGDDRGDTQPFRGRVRFTPFWHVGDEAPTGPLTLMPLTSPSGNKMKSRPLYLAPGDDGLAADYSEDGAALKGRKLYWHQRSAPEASRHGLPLQHVADGGTEPGLLRDESGAPTLTEQMSGPTIRPLPAGSRFTGELHFSNLTEFELGALLVAVAPDLAFGSDAGLKVGKGKPRGLGSIRCAEISVSLLVPVRERYRALGEASTRICASEDVSELVQRYRRGAAERGGVVWEQLEFVQDLRRLLTIPKEPRVHVYPPRFDMYGRPPEFGQPQGDPRNGRRDRSPAMRRSRDL